MKPQSTLIFSAQLQFWKQTDVEGALGYNRGTLRFGLIPV